MKTPADVRSAFNLITGFDYRHLQLQVDRSLSDGNVTFRWRDSAHGNKKRLMTLAVDEFLRRFLLHLLPPGFVRNRNFGFLANRKRATLLPLCLRLLGGSRENTATSPTPTTAADQAGSDCTPPASTQLRVPVGLPAALTLCDLNHKGVRSYPQEEG